MKSLRGAAIALALLIGATPSQAQDDSLYGWFQWRGPAQSGVSSETGLPDRCDPADQSEKKSLLWSLDIKSRGSVVTAGDRAYIWGYRGEKEKLAEVLACLDLDSGKLLWEQVYHDFLSDIIYDRYSIGAPAIDPESKQIFVLTSPGLLEARSLDGKLNWQVSMGEDFGRLTFPNGRTGAPAIDGDLVIINAITSNWGADGPAANRFYAFNKHTGQLVWSSTPGLRPRDNSFATPWFEWRDGMRVFYAGTGCGFIACINANTGLPIWRFPLSEGGVNSSVLVKGDRLVAVHGIQNLDDSTVGRMVGIKLGAQRAPGAAEPTTLGKESELWRAPIAMFSSSPVLVGDLVYQLSGNGELFCLNIESGKILWRKKLDSEQIHSSPLYVDGKLYCAMSSGKLFVIKPSAESCTILSETQLEGSCLGSPTVWRRRLFLPTTARLYCFGPAERGPIPSIPASLVIPAPGAPAGLKAIPSEVLLQPGSKQKIELRLIDAKGRDLGAAPAKGPLDKLWESFIPPTAKVKARLDASFTPEGEIAAAPEAKPSAGAFKASLDGRAAVIRGRVLAKLPINEDLESFELSEKSEIDQASFAYPPLPWIGARFKWEVRELEGSKVLAKTLDRVLFQRSTTFIGPSNLSNYTIAADIRSDGNRRLQSSIGLINQRYIVFLDGNWQRLEVFSNQERFKVSVPYAWKAKVWYRLEVRVDLEKDGSGVVRARVWPKSESKPEAWTIEARHEGAHREGAPGFFAFSPQSQFRVYLDNVNVTPNKP